jgi:hypothetical protein
MKENDSKMMDGCRFTLCDHRINYVSLCPPEGRKKSPNGLPESKVVINLTGNGIWAYCANEEYREHSIRGLLAVQFEEADYKASLVKWWKHGMGGLCLPKRDNPMFGGKRMEPFHCGFSTFFDVTTVSGNLEEHALKKMFENCLTGETPDDRTAELDMMGELEDKLVALASQELGLEGGFYNVRCSLRQSRFSTAIKERTAPMWEMTTEQHEKLHELGGRCVHFILPLCDEIMMFRLFKNREDNKGTQVMLMPGTIAMFPSTAIMEYGRVTNVKGHPHLLVKVIVTKDEMDLNCLQLLAENKREYPHLPKTTKKFQTQHEDDWERDLRFVDYLTPLPRMKGLETSKLDLAFLESRESKTLNKFM